MKYVFLTTNTFSLLSLLFILVLFEDVKAKGGLKDYKPKKSIDITNINADSLSEKELDDLLKDPNSASIKINPKAELKKPKSKESKYSEKYKEHLESLDKEGLNVETPLNVEEEDYGQGMPPDSKHKRPTPQVKGDKTDEDKAKEPPKKRKEYNFSFLNERNIQYLTEIFRQPVYYGMLSEPIKALLNTTVSNPNYVKQKSDMLSDVIEASMSNSQSSTIFVDPDGWLGRKGMLTIIDPKSSSTQFVWTVVNSKVLCFYKSQSFLTIVKLYRLSEVKLFDITATPCFRISSAKNENECFVCTTSINEKEIWMQTLQRSID